MQSGRNWHLVDNTDDTVILSIREVSERNRGREWRFPLTAFTEDQLTTLFQERKPCPGCVSLPTKGFKSDKRSWCDLSRAVAVQQDNQGA